jgi:septum formation protein
VADEGAAPLLVPSPLLVLASGSPRRHELLASLGLAFVVDAADIDETELPGEDPRTYVVRLAQSKAEHVAARHPVGTVVIGADTTVDLNGTILGKPDDAAHATAMLRGLSGVTHCVHTGMAVVVAGTDAESWTMVSTTVSRWARLALTRFRGSVARSLPG